MECDGLTHWIAAVSAANLKKLRSPASWLPFREVFSSLIYEGKTFFEKKVLPLKLPFPKNFK